MTQDELMVGNWVRYKGHAYQIEEISRPTQRVSLAAPRAVRFAEIKDLEPLPLTKDILLRSDFEVDEEDENNLYMEYDGMWWVRWHPKETNYTRGSFSYVDIEHGCVTLTELPCDSVHELQNAMALCHCHWMIHL